MECHKWRALNKVLKRTMLSIEVFIDAMIELEEEARACYEGTIALNSYEFTEMLVRDGCFVLELFTGYQEGFSKLGYERNDPVFAIRGSLYYIQRDMILLENQLPLFVLNRLLELQLGTHNQTGYLLHLVARFFDRVMPTDVALGTGRFVCPSADGLAKLHCVDVLRGSKPKPKTMSPRTRRHWRSRVQDKLLNQMIPSATELRAAGFQFRIRMTDRFWDIKFNDGYLEIPSVVIHEGTKSLLLNLIAFEQCHVESSNNITSYCVFMNNLIDSAEDASYFHECGILEHSLRSHSEVVDMFNQLCQDVVMDTKDIYLSPLLTTVYHRYHKDYINKWQSTIEMDKHLATLKERYFDNPWAYLPFLAAVILLVLTVCQTYFAAYAYFH